MGTSISQGSPRTSKWRPLYACYSNEKISENNVIKEVWKAADNPNENVRWSTEIKSDIIFKCFQTVKNSNNAIDAIAKYNKIIIQEKKNSIAAELAKRSIHSAYFEKNHTNAWAKKMIKEISNYIISRDTSGFVGDKYRNKSVTDLVKFKNSLNKTLSTKLEGLNSKNISSKSQWNKFVEKTIKDLKK